MNGLWLWCVRARVWVVCTHMCMCKCVNVCVRVCARVEGRGGSGLGVKLVFPENLGRP